MCARGSTRFQVRCDVPPVHQELDRGVILPLRIHVAAALPSSQTSRPQTSFQLLGALFESDEIDPGSAMPFTARHGASKEPNDSSALLFKVRPVEGSTVRHEALDADAMLHHHVCRQTTSMPQSRVNCTAESSALCSRITAAGAVTAQHGTALRSRAHAAVLAIVIPLTLLSTTSVLEESNGGACDDISLPIPSHRVTPAVLIILKGPTIL